MLTKILPGLLYKQLMKSGLKSARVSWVKLRDINSNQAHRVNAPSSAKPKIKQQDTSDLRTDFIHL